MIKWTPELDNIIMESIEAGYTAREIGIKIGATKNAVLGRANRMGLGSGRIIKKHVVQSTSRFRIFKPTPPPEPEPEPEKTAGPVPPEPEPEKTAGPVTIFNLTSQSCRYPVSGARLGTLFCNENRMKEHSYCQKHYRIAYRLMEFR